jgi:tetratricopeptide (TPR) repeat protein
VSVAGTSLDAELSQLRRERDSLIAVRNSTPREIESGSDSVAAQRELLKQQLNGLLTELARRPRPEQKPATSETGPKAKSPAQQRASKSKRNKFSRSAGDGTKPTDGSQTPTTQAPVDAMALAQSLFRTSDYEGALKAFDLAKKTTADPHDRVAIKYFSAACLRKLGNTQESMMLFREVANSKADEVLAECAQWQLSAQQWRDTTKARIEQLRAVQLAEQANSGNQSLDGETQAKNQGDDAKP